MKILVFFEKLHGHVTIRLLIKISITSGIVTFALAVICLVPYLYFKPVFYEYWDVFFLWIAKAAAICFVIFVAVLWFGVVFPLWFRFLWRYPYFRNKLTEVVIMFPPFKIFGDREKIDQEIRRKRDEV